MYIALTKHSKQRRPHHRVKEDKEILPWIRYFIKKFNLENKEDDIYKIQYKGKAAILKKERDRIVVITFRGFDDFSKKDEYKIRLTKENHQAYVYRINYKGKKVSCGKIKKGKVYLREGLKTSYKIDYDENFKALPMENKFIHFNKKLGEWFLNDFERRETEIIYKKNEEGNLIVCGRIVEGKVNLNYSLLSTKISREKFFSSPEELISFDKKENQWMLIE